MYNFYYWEIRDENSACKCHGYECQQGAAIRTALQHMESRDLMLARPATDDEVAEWYGVKPGEPHWWKE